MLAALITLVRWANMCLGGWALAQRNSFRQGWVQIHIFGSNTTQQNQIQIHWFSRFQLKYDSSTLPFFKFDLNMIQIHYSSSVS